MVAGHVAGIGPAWQAVVKLLSGMYGLLAAASLGVAMLLPPPAQGRAVSVGESPLYVYQQLIGPHDGRVCPSFPVCSLYARQALQAHGLLVGSWLMLDRLIHEGGDMQDGPWLLAADGKRLYDPLGRNDDWLKVARPSDSSEQEQQR